jgi:glycolate oxidase iron-sulfur subunit
MHSTFDSSIYSQCVRCGLCLPSCPTYVETLVETSSPRGRIALIKAVDEGRIDLLSPGFVAQMYECLDCRACEAVCPSGVEYGKLLEPARAKIEAARAPQRPARERMVRRFALDSLFNDLALMRLVAGFVRLYQRTGLRAFARGSGLLQLFGLERMEALAPRISDRFFVPRGQRWKAEGGRKLTAFLHAGCIQSVAFAHVDEATVRVLQRAGCDVVAPGDQGCCGAIAVHSGEPALGIEMAKRNIVAFERSKADVYAINAAGCGATLKEYGALFAGVPEWHERAVAFSAKVKDVLELLDEIGIDRRLGPVAGPVAYQDPCHLGYAQRVTAAPRRLLAQIPGLRVVELDDAALCCGSAGIYNLTHPEISLKLRERKVEAILASGAAVVATANPGCELQIENGLRARGNGMQVKHVVEILDDAYAAYQTSRSS